MSLFPLRFMYLISDVFLYPVIYHLVRYRRKVVRRNLSNSFPEKDEKEIRNVERKFYHQFCDIFFETIRILGMTEDEAKKRMVFENPEVVTDFASKGQSVFTLLGHYGNWEYQSFLFFYILESGNQKGFSVYRPLKNKAFDYLYMKIRSRFRAGIVTKSNTYRTIIRLRNEGFAGVFGLVSDQSPSRTNLHYWTKFLNQDTSILTGPERIARKTGAAVVYADVRRLKRGQYSTKYILISEKPQETAQNEITERYARLMENTILRDPAYWLWTHKRWKHKMEDVCTENKSGGIE